MARTKEFDEDAVLLKAMRLFWEQGYEKTSMADLVSHMGVHKRSLYDTFGDKHSLYMKTLKRYGDIIQQWTARIVKNSGSAEDAIRKLLQMTIKREDGTPRGCLMINTAVELALHDEEFQAWVKEGLNGFEELLRGIITEGQRSGELDASLDADMLSAYLNNAFTGLRVLGKTTDDNEKLNQIIETTLSVLKHR
ncbi:TetR/AcrR family transcriptional regulator [Paenibacillus hodogayensis]|uniref:TetR/AcrR family transcriptional regulator n=1 Tax=Paenibacillus hodogayensis TaxID=279208 RepID=A0ABV5W2Y0_9BACL